MCLSSGFTLAFGAIFAKTWRVHRITRLVTMKKKVNKTDRGIAGHISLVR